jgi:hypothetical protein
MNAPAIELDFPSTWRAESCAVFQRLADAGKVDQAEIDRVEMKLQWYRENRDYYARYGTFDGIAS